MKLTNQFLIRSSDHTNKSKVETSDGWPMYYNLMFPQIRITASKLFPIEIIS